MVKSIRAKDDPKRVHPKTEKVEPMRNKLRSDMDDPRCNKSSNANEEPNRVQPTSEIVDPTRRKPRIDKEEAI